jgi:hypothetical protein
MPVRLCSKAQRSKKVVRTVVSVGAVALWPKRRFQALWSSALWVLKPILFTLWGKERVRLAGNGFAASRGLSDSGR